MTQRPSQIDREVFSRILAVARHLGATADLGDILRVVIDAMRDTLNAERATVFEFDPKSNELFSTVAHGVGAEQKPDVGDQASRPSARQLPISESSPAELRFHATLGLAGECAQSRRIISVPDAYADMRFNQKIDRQTGFRTRSILTIPLLGHDGELVGVAQVLNKRGGPFTPDDEEIAQALAGQAAVAMKRGRLLDDRLVRQRLERDLELARRIQQGSFPDSMPVMRAFDIAAWNQPADETGGDVYDVIVRDDSHDGASSQRVVLLMADATGHGVGPALSVTQLRSMLRMAVRLNAHLADIAGHANQQLCEDLPGGRFITAWFGELHDEPSTLTMVSAGQAPLLHYDSTRRCFDVLDATTVPLGVLDDAEMITSPAIHMKPGDIFAVISDGIFEARNPADEQFGCQRVMDCISAHTHGAAEPIIEALRTALNRFTNNQPAEDDRTAIVITRKT